MRRRSDSRLRLPSARRLGSLGGGAYKVVNTAKVGGEGGFDYVDADPDTRHLYVVRSGRPGGRISIYDLDSLKLLSEIPNVNGGHAVAFDPKNGHAFSSSNPVVMFDSKTLAVIKTIQVQGNPDGIFFEPSTARVYILSRGDPNVTAINTSDGTIAGTIDLGGEPKKRGRWQGTRLYLRRRQGPGRRSRLQGNEDHRALQPGPAADNRRAFPWTR